MPLLTRAPSQIDARRTTVAVFRYSLATGQTFGDHDHEQHQLTWAPGGTLCAQTPGAQWSLPRTMALWIPGGMLHDVGVERECEVIVIKFNAMLCARLDRDAVAVPVTGVMRAIAGRLADPGFTGERRRRMEQVLLDELTPVAPSLVAVPMPTDDRAIAVAERVIADPADGRTLAEWGRVVGAGERTLVRYFAEQTGLTFSAWRTHVRMRAASAHLERGGTTTAAAALVGYRDVGAFIDAFRRTMGCTPGSFKRRCARPATWPVGDRREVAPRP